MIEMTQEVVQNMVTQLDKNRELLRRDDLTEEERNQILQVVGYLEQQINEANKNT